MHVILLIEKKSINFLMEEYISHSYLSKKYGIEVILAYKENKNIELKWNKYEMIKKYWIRTFWYEKDKELIYFWNKLKNKWNIFVTTFSETMVLYTNKIRKKLNLPITDNFKVFLTKHLQRENLLKKHPETTIKYKLLKKWEKLKKNDIQFPVFVKPTWWMTSLWSWKFHNICQLNNHLEKINWDIFNLLKNEWLEKQEKILVEEFIDWNLYAMSYYVDEQQNIYLNKFMKQIDNLWWKHTHLIWWEVSENIQKEINTDEFKVFSNKTIKWLWIKNTFVCHQFKKNSKWKLKTIELNWRIGWTNVELYWYLYKLNFYSVLKNKKFDMIDNAKWWAWFFWLYPNDKQEFKWYNKKLLEEIIKLKSIKRFFLKNEKKWAEIWPPIYWHTYPWIMFLYNENYNIFKKDFEFIKKNYYDFFKK